MSDLTRLLKIVALWAYLCAGLGYFKKLKEILLSCHDLPVQHKNLASGHSSRTEAYNDNRSWSMSSGVNASSRRFYF